MIRFFRRSLAAKLLVAFAAIILVSVGSVAVLANQRTAAEFDTYLSMEQQMAEQHATGMMGMMTPAGTHSQTESGFLDRVNRSLVMAALGAGLVALLVGGLLARRITRPLRELTRAAQQIAQGHLDKRIQVSGADEVGQLAQAFNQMAESLARTEAARRHLVADVAHELRTPLAVVRGTMQAMREGVLPRDEENFGTVQEEVDALIRLVADLRDLSLGDVGQFPVQCRSVDLAPVLEQTAAAFAAEAVAHEIAFSVDLAPGLPSVEADEDRLRQALRNLIANAIRHTPSKGQVALSAQAVSGGVEIRVRDTGEGIAPEHLPHVFERFYRADPSRARDSGGTGLGLAIVQQIVQAHGGEIAARSDGLGQGATFTLRLPVGGRADLPSRLKPEGL